MADKSGLDGTGIGTVIPAGFLLTDQGCENLHLCAHRNNSGAGAAGQSSLGGNSVQGQFVGAQILTLTALEFSLKCSEGSVV